MKARLLFLIAFTLTLSQAEAQKKLMTKLVSKMASVVGDKTTTTTADLTTLTPHGGMASNVHPTDLGTLDQSFYKTWKDGGDMVAFMFISKGGSGTNKIDGTVTIDGQPAEYSSIGTYVLFTDPGTSPRTVEITSTSGQTSKFTIAPNKHNFKVLSVNGQKDDVSLDLNQDVVIELENAPSSDTFLKVNLAINQVGIKAFYAVCYVRSAATITIPAAAFRNINLKPGGDAIYSYKGSYLTVESESLQSATDVSGAFPEVTYTASYADGMFVTVAKEPNLNKGLTAKGKENMADGAMEYNFYKPNAFMSRPASQISKIGVISFGISGKTFSENSVITQEEDQAKGEAQITKTTTIVFPQQTTETWTAVLEKMYPEIMSIVQEVLSAEILPLAATTKTEGYKAVEEFSVADKNTAEEFSKSYPNSRLLTVAPFDEGYGTNAANERIMKDTGADALLSLTLDFQLEQDGDFGVLVPKLAFEIAGKINGLSTNTKYFTGTITGKGIRTEDIGLTIKYSSPSSMDLKGRNDTKVLQTEGEITAEELDKLIRRSDLLTTFRKGLAEIRDMGEANTDYEVVWAMRK